MIKRYREKHFVTGYRPYIVLEFFFSFLSLLFFSLSLILSLFPPLLGLTAML